MEERLGEMRKGRRERMRKGGYDKLELKHQNLLFFQVYRIHYLKKKDICDRLWENGAFGAENKNVDFNLF